MKIGYEAKRIFHNKSGLGNYSRNLIRMLSTYYPHNEYLLFNPAEPTVPFALPPSCREIRPQLKNNFYRNLWRQRLLSKDAKREGVEIFHGLSAELPQGLKKRNIKTIVTVHDLIFMRYPKLYKRIDRNIYRQKLKAACKRAHRIVAISEQTKRDIIEYLKIDAERISIIPPGIDPIYWQSQQSQYARVIQQYQLPARYALFVGTLEPRKNPVLLAQQCLILGIPLVLVGRKTPYWLGFYNGLSANEKAKIFTPRVSSNADLAALYQMADLMAYPSVFEGFGLPVLEAQASKTPVLTANLSSLPEAAGPGSVLVDPREPEQLREGLQGLWEKPPHLAKAVAENYGHALNYSDKILAQLWHKTYQQL